MKKIALIAVLMLTVPVLFLAGEVAETTTDILSTSLSQLTADKAVGSAVKVGDKTMIPLFEANAGFGGGLGGPEGVAYGGGAGGGLSLLPYSVLIISEDGVDVIPVSNKTPFLEQIVHVLPDLMPIISQVMQYLSVDPSGAPAQGPSH